MVVAVLELIPSLNPEIDPVEEAMVRALPGAAVPIPTLPFPIIRILSANPPRRLRVLNSKLALPLERLLAAKIEAPVTLAPSTLKPIPDKAPTATPVLVIVSRFSPTPRTVPVLDALISKREDGAVAPTPTFPLASTVILL